MDTKKDRAVELARIISASLSELVECYDNNKTVRLWLDSFGDELLSSSADEMAIAWRVRADVLEAIP